MAVQINQLIRQAMSTFGGLKELLPKNIEALKNILDKTKSTDLGFYPEHDIFKQETWIKPGKAPASYCGIYEDNNITVGVFILGENGKLPLHNHPQMHGLIKVIHGTLKVSSFTITQVLKKCSFEVECHQPEVVHYLDAPCILEPTRQNLHEIESVNGIAAFLDILAPPYETEFGTRECTYYRRVRQTGINKMILEEIECPSWFWTDKCHYQGPPIEEFMIHEKESEIV